MYVCIYIYISVYTHVHNTYYIYTSMTLLPIHLRCIPIIFSLYLYSHPQILTSSALTWRGQQARCYGHGVRLVSRQCGIHADFNQPKEMNHVIEGGKQCQLLYLFNHLWNCFSPIHTNMTSILGPNIAA